MKFKIIIIGLALVLALCISPVAAVSGDDFEIVSGKEEGDLYYTYKYRNMNNPDEKYTKITTGGTSWLYSLVTFQPANIGGAPMMIVNTDGNKYIYLPRSVDEWEIKYYSRFGATPNLTYKYLKNAGVLNLNEFFGKYIEKGLELELSMGQYFSVRVYKTPHYSIPDVN